MVFKEYFTKKQQAYHCRPLKPHTGSNQLWPLVALKGSKMVNPGLAQVIQHKDICHTIIDLCSSENYVPPKIQIPKSKLQNLKSKLQDPKSEVQNPKPKLQNPKSKLQDPNSKIKTPRSKIKTPRSWGKLENGQHVHIIVSRYCNVRRIFLLDVFEGRMLEGIAK